MPAFDRPGAPSRDYPFFAANQDLAALGYVEEEFSLEGEAVPYSTPYAAKTFDQAQALGPPQPYRTRILVRSPREAGRFNGVVIVEWNNASNGFDSPNIWFQGWEHMTRAGYAWVGVTAQGFGGAQALKTWSPARYGALDIPNGGRMAAEPLALDIFAEAGEAVRGGAGLGGLKPRLLIAAGQSQSANWLASYINGGLPSESYDGFLLLSPSGIPIRPSPARPLFQILTEGDIRGPAAALASPDSFNVRQWEVAGASHVDRHLRTGREPLEMRDLGSSVQAALAPKCDVQEIGTETPANHVLASALDHLAAWAAQGPSPPKAQPLMRTPDRRAVALDASGRSSGGVRLAAVDASVGINRGLNDGAPGCLIQGSYQPYDDLTVRRLYSSRKAYVRAVETIARKNARDGFILPEDAQATIEATRLLPAW